MLGALFEFLSFLLPVYWWVLNRQFRSFRKGVGGMTILQFVIYVILSVVIVGFILMMISGCFLLEYDDNISLALMIVVLTLLVSFQSYHYIKTIKKQKEPKTVENVDLD